MTHTILTPPDALPARAISVNATDRSKRLVGIDYLRAIASLAVVGWHMAMVDRSNLFNVNRYNPKRYHIHASDIGNFYGLLLAVPVFILISNYLFVRKNPTVSDFRRQFFRVGLLLAFWPAAYMVWYRGSAGLWTLFAAPGSNAFYRFFQAGSTIYYFFAGLLVSLILTYILSCLPTAISLATAIGTWLLLAALPLLAQRYPLYFLCAYWQPLNFLPYAPLAVLIHRHRLALRPIPAALVLLVAGILVAVIEWHYAISPAVFATESYGFPAYTRPSLPLLSGFLLLIGLLPGWKSNPIISFMSRHSLGLYCLHIFMMPIVPSITGPLHLSHRPLQLCSYACVILLAYAFSLVLPIFLQHKLLR